MPSRLRRRRPSAVGRTLVPRAKELHHGLSKTRRDDQVGDRLKCTVEKHQQTNAVQQALKENVVHRHLLKHRIVDNVEQIEQTVGQQKQNVQEDDNEQHDDHLKVLR